MKPTWTIPVIIALSAIIGFLAYNQIMQSKRIEELERSQQQVPPDMSSLGSTKDPFAEMERMRERMDQLFQTSFGTADPFGGTPLPGSLSIDPIKSPSVQVKEKKDRFVVVVSEVDPDSQEIEANIDGQRLTLNLKSKESKADNKSTDSGRFSTFSSSSQTYSSSVEFTQPVDVSSMQTNVESDRIVITVQKANT